MQRDDLWRRGLEASRQATSPQCAANDWVYLETLVYLYAWYQTALPTNPAEAQKFANDFHNKTAWAAHCLSVDRNSSTQHRCGEAGACRVMIYEDTASFWEKPPHSDVQPQRDEQGRTIPQLVELLKATDQELLALRQERDRLSNELSVANLLRATGAEHNAFHCTVRSKSTGLWWVVSPEHELRTGPLESQTKFEFSRGDFGWRYIMALNTQTHLLGDAFSPNVATIAKQRMPDSQRNLLEFTFFGPDTGGFWNIIHAETGRVLYENGGAIGWPRKGDR